MAYPARHDALCVEGFHGAPERTAGGTLPLLNQVCHLPNKLGGTNLKGHGNEADFLGFLHKEVPYTTF